VPLVSRVVECGEREWAPPRKIIFIPQNEKFGCIFKQFLTGRKHGQSCTRSLGTRILRFYRETRLTKTVQKLSKSSRSDQRGSHHRPHP